MHKTLHARESHGWDREKLTWPHHADSRFIDAAGLRWHVQQMGAGPPMLLVHGTGASTHSWRDVMPRLARGFAVTAVDLPGHAFTDPLPAHVTSIEGMSNSLAALLGVLRFNPAFCVGHSAGAVILCNMALASHIEPRAMISINGAFLPLGGLAGAWLSPVARLLANNTAVAALVAHRARNAQATVRRLIARTGSTLDEEGIELYARLVRKPHHVAGALRMMGNWNLRAFQSVLPKLSVPLTLMVGNNDLMVPPQQASIVQRQLRGARVLGFAGLGHLAHEEQPGLFADQIAAICVPS